MAADVPLLSSYKRGFVGRRVFHTLTGFKPHPGNQPFFIPIIQVLSRFWKLIKKKTKDLF